MMAHMRARSPDLNVWKYYDRDDTLGPPPFIPFHFTCLLELLLAQNWERSLRYSVAQKDMP